MADFEIIRVLGQGTYGKVYLVHSKLDGTRQVIKQIPLQGLSEKQRKDTLNETKIHSQIQHPNIIRFHQWFTEDNNLYIRMEYAEQGDLMHLIEAHKKESRHIREDAIWEYLTQICRGLQYLHNKRILHRDIKARNIFLDSNLNIKIGDLGLGRKLGDASYFAYTAVGTPLYFSPEMCQERAYNEKSDVWALGCLVYEMAALEPPFMATNQLALAKRICEETHKPLPDGPGYSKDLGFVIANMLQKDPTKRPTVKQILSFAPVQHRQLQIQLKFERRANDQMRSKIGSLSSQVESFRRRAEQLSRDMAETEKQRLADSRRFEQCIAVAEHDKEIAEAQAIAYKQKVVELTRQLDESHKIIAAFGNAREVKFAPDYASSNTDDMLDPSSASDSEGVCADSEAEFHPQSGTSADDLSPFIPLSSSKSDEDYLSFLFSAEILNTWAGLDCSDIPVVKSLKARYKGASDGDFLVCKNLSDPIPLRVSPMALLEKANSSCNSSSKASEESNEFSDNSTGDSVKFAEATPSSSLFYFFDVNLNPIDGPVEEIILAFEKRNVSKVQEVIILLPDKRFIGFASSLPLDPAEQWHHENLSSEAPERKDADDSLSSNTIPTNIAAPRSNAVVTTRKLCASEMETLLDKVKRFQDRKRSISPKPC
eukprot:g2370.t1